MYKAVISDLDGTLLNEEYKVSLFTKETIELLLKKGIKFYIATGRGYIGAKEIMNEINLKIPLITSNGARIMDEEGMEIYVNNIEQKYVDKIFSIDYKLYDKGIILNGFSGNHWYVTEDARDYFYTQKPNRKQYPEQIEREDFDKLAFTKIFFLGEHRKLLEIEKEIRKLTNEEVNIVFVNERSLEIFSKDCDKAVAADFLLKRDGLTLQDAVSFGDGFNDYDLITQAGLGFAMKNSIYLLLEKLKNTEVIESNANDGMARKVREIFNL
nr:HAD family hydrolase [uncultured Leptotrichia sp.]